jgi:hypothetical protein
MTLEHITPMTFESDEHFSMVTSVLRRVFMIVERDYPKPTHGFHTSKNVSKVLKKLESEKYIENLRDRLDKHQGYSIPDDQKFMAILLFRFCVHAAYNANSFVEIIIKKHRYCLFSGLHNLIKNGDSKNLFQINEIK